MTKETMLLLFLSLLGLEVSIYTHKASNSSHILICEGLQVL